MHKPKSHRLTAPKNRTFRSSLRVVIMVDVKLTRRLARDIANDCVETEQSRLNVVLRTSDLGGTRPARGVERIARRSMVIVSSPR